MATKRGEAALVRMIEEGIAESAALPADRFGLMVTSVDVVGSPPHLVRAAATLFFLASGEPFCCGEPGCYSDVFVHPSEALGDYLRARMRLRQKVSVQLETSTVYAEGIRFTALV